MALSLRRSPVEVWRYTNRHDYLRVAHFMCVARWALWGAMGSPYRLAPVRGMTPARFTHKNGVSRIQYTLRLASVERPARGRRVAQA